MAEGLFREGITAGRLSAEAYAENFGDLSQREAGVVVQNEHRPVGRRQARQAPKEGIADLELGDAVTDVGHGVVDRDLAHAGASRASGFLQAEPDEQAVRPGVEPVWVAKGRQLLPDGDQRALGSVLGAVVVANDPLRGQVEPGTDSARKRLVRLPVPGLRAFDQRAIHSTDLSCRLGEAAHPIRGPGAPRLSFHATPASPDGPAGAAASPRRKSA